MVTGGTSKVVMRDWYSDPPPMLTFTAEEANSTISMSKYGSPPDASLEYSIDGGATWSAFIEGSTTVTLVNVGDQMFLRATSTNYAMCDESSYRRFNLSGKIAASGSIMYLLDKEGSPDAVIHDHCFEWLFSSQSSLTSSPDFPALTLAPYCYRYMFNWCEGLVTAPDILPATTLAEGCYWDMFSGCTHLAKAPYLPATELAPYCYQYMFNVDYMMNEVKIGYTGNFDSTYFNEWLASTSGTGTFYYNGSDTTRGSSAIPYDWVV